MDDKPDDSPCRYPSQFQRRVFWAAVTAVAIVIIAAVSVGAVILGGKVLGYLQPILVPIAVAGIIAYLLEPVIKLLRKKTRWKHKTCMYVVFSVFLALVTLLFVAVLVPGVGQARGVVEDWDTHKSRIYDVMGKGLDDLQTRFNSPTAKKYYDKGIEWITEEGPKFGQKIGLWTWDKLMGAFGFFGYLLGLILVPIYLFFFLKESHTIKNTWSDYLPLRASRFKDEVVDTLKEVNQYLISFFRGQMVVSLIDGALVAVALSLILQLPYALLIGVFLAILGLIPYIGNALVMIPAVLIAIAHFSETGTQYLPVTSDVAAGQVIKVGGRNKYVNDVSIVTRVNVKGTDGQIVKGYVKSPPATETDAANPDPFPVGKVTTVSLDNGGTVTKEIVSVAGQFKRTEYMKNAWSFLPKMWFYPLIVIAIFFTLQQINGLVTAPKIVGDSVGLHPLTVIFSVLFWSFLLGGLLGALLAVPLTASLKVLFRRYIWVAKIEPKVGPFGEASKRTVEDDVQPA